MKFSVQSVCSNLTIPYQKPILDPGLPGWNQLFFGESKARKKIVRGLVATRLVTGCSPRFKNHMLLVSESECGEMENICHMLGGTVMDLSEEHSINMFNYPLEISYFKRSFVDEVYTEIIAKYPSESLNGLDRKFTETNAWSSQSFKANIERKFPLIKIEYKKENVIPSRDYILLVSEIIGRMVSKTKASDIFEIEKLVTRYYDQETNHSLEGFKNFLAPYNGELSRSISLTANSLLTKDSDWSLSISGKKVIHAYNSKILIDKYLDVYNDFVVARLHMETQRVDAYTLRFSLTWADEMCVSPWFARYWAKIMGENKKIGNAYFHTVERDLSLFNLDSDEKINNVEIMKNVFEVAYLFRVLKKSVIPTFYKKVFDSIPDSTKLTLHTLGDKFLKEKPSSENDVLFLPILIDNKTETAGPFVPTTNF